MAFIAPEGIEFREGRPQSTTSGGVPYVTFAVDQVVPEGQRIPDGPDTLEKAWDLFNTAVAEYLASAKAKTVEWRVRPTVEDRRSLNDSWRIRSRLAVTEVN